MKQVEEAKKKIEESSKKIEEKKPPQKVPENLVQQPP
jgi:hypothetical protein